LRYPSDGFEVKMKRCSSAVILFVVWGWLGCWQGAAQSPPVFEINQPTIIAFFPITEAEVDKDGDAGEALDDLNYYVFLAEKRLHRAGVAIHIANAQSFQIRAGKKLVTYQPNKNEIGYYLISPGKEPHIENDVMTDEDILDAARKYFSITIR
jgi:hypothetical protein